jgi:hypothetical protein
MDWSMDMNIKVASEVVTVTKPAESERLKGKKGFTSYPFGSDYLMELDESWYEDKQILHLDRYLGRNGWLALLNLDIDESSIYDLMKSVRYECPYSMDGDIYFFGVLPTVIFSDNSRKYRTEDLQPGRYDYIFDSEYTKETVFGIECSFSNELPMDSIQSAHLGHGYTLNRLNSDGNGRVVDAAVPLSNGDYLGVKTFEWFNK